MRRTLYALAALTLMAAANGCKKEEEADIRKVPDTGMLRFKNTSADLYDIFIDDTRMGNLYGGDSATYPNISANYHRVSARQMGNIVGTATYRTQTIYVKKDTVSTFYFP